MTHWHVISTTQGEQNVFATHAEARRWMRWAGTIYGVLVLRRCTAPWTVGGACSEGLRRLKEQRRA